MTRSLVAVEETSGVLLSSAILVIAGVGGGDFPDHGIHFIAGDRALHGVGRFDFIAFIIDNDKLDGIAIFNVGVMA